MHDGFYAALFHRPEGTRVCLFDELVGLLRRVGSDVEAGEKLPLYLTGHSLGGAIASVFLSMRPGRSRSRIISAYGSAPSNCPAGFESPSMSILILSSEPIAIPLLWG